MSKGVDGPPPLTTGRQDNGGPLKASEPGGVDHEPGTAPEMSRLHQSRIVIEHLTPQLEGGRYPIKRAVGEELEVRADVFRDGHDVLTVVLKHRPSDERLWTETPMSCVNPGLDHWAGRFRLERAATYLYTIEAWTDVFESWRRELRKKVEAGQDVTSELLEGTLLIKQAIPLASRAEAAFLRLCVEGIAAQPEQAAAIAMALDDNLAGVMRLCQPRAHATTHEPLEVVVDPVKARFAAWYELFPRSQSPDPNRSGTFRDCIEILPDIQRMGFDVVYLPPIHPIGRTHRKGRNNSLTAAAGDPGSPWAIGNEQGGHKAVEPALGTLADFEAFVQAAGRLGIDVALDFAIQCSPDHPYVKEHPEWFYHRPDGTIKYAENPPKKYQDIYPLNFDSDAWPSLWEEMKSIFLFWIARGVKTFRVDNPHTKPVRFWEWVIRAIKSEHPEVIFLSEAFTRPRMMQALAKSGFTQSYTYFTWRNGKQELTEYLTELTQTEMAEYFRGNLFANTPDILHAYLQQGGRPAFKVRLVLAATLSSVYGIYSGFELCENTPAHAGSEEYLDSEKYEIKHRDWNQPGNLREFIALVNRTRRENPALQLYQNLCFHSTDNEQIICYSKATLDYSNTVLVVVNLDPHRPQEGYVRLDLGQLGLNGDQRYEVRDQVTGAVYHWHGAHHYVRLDANYEPAHLLVIRK